MSSSQPQRGPDTSTTGQDPVHAAEIHGISRMQIFDGCLDRFKQLAQQCVDIVNEHDSGTLEYRLYINPAGTAAFVHERYRDSGAGLEHMRNISSMMKPLSQVCTMTGEVCGNPTAELRDALTEAGITIYSPLVSSD